MPARKKSSWTPERRAAASAAAKARTAAVVQREREMAPIAGGSTGAAVADEPEPLSVAPPVETRQYDAASAQEAIRAAVFAAEQEPEFDQGATYVVLRSCIARKKGPAGQLRDPLFYGDFVSKELLAAPAVVSPADANRNCQEATDGIADLERFWLNGDIELPSHPAAAEAIRLRALATAVAPENTPARRRGQKAKPDEGRLADIRLHVVGNGGSVYGFASGELVG